VIPKDNEGDLEDVPEEVQKQLTFHPVETLKDVLTIALVPETTHIEIGEEEEIPAGVA
jgi:ATP-dependent Lon protease